jgi:hypothetical protein
MAESATVYWLLGKLLGGRNTTLAASTGSVEAVAPKYCSTLERTAPLRNNETVTSAPGAAAYFRRRVRTPTPYRSLQGALTVAPSVEALRQRADECFGPGTSRADMPAAAKLRAPV